MQHEIDIYSWHYGKKMWNFPTAVWLRGTWGRVLLINTSTIMLFRSAAGLFSVKLTHLTCVSLKPDKATAQCRSWTGGAEQNQMHSVLNRDWEPESAFGGRWKYKPWLPSVLIELVEQHNLVEPLQSLPLMLLWAMQSAALLKQGSSRLEPQNELSIGERRKCWH